MRKRDKEGRNNEGRDKEGEHNEGRDNGGGDKEGKITEVRDSNKRKGCDVWG